VITVSRYKQRNSSPLILHIDIRASSQVLFDSFNISFFARLMECSLKEFFDE
jgi:hypothetical protein